MSFTREMINTHPQIVSEPKKDTLIAAIEACYDCSQACATCSDACLGEEDVQSLRTVIRSTADCSDICSAIGRILSRLNNPSFDCLRSIVQACIVQVRKCGADCTEHARHHEHCRICTDACRKCENTLTDYFETIKSK